MNPAETYLASADRLLTQTARGARGVWPQACAWLLRLALEAALDRFWQTIAPEVAECGSRRAQVLLLHRYADPATARRVGYLWWALSRAGHHHGYELALTAGELRRLGTDVAAVVATLRDTG